MKKLLLAFGLLAASVAHAVTLNTQTTTLPTETTPATVVATAPQKTFRSGFDAAVAVGPDTTYFTAIQTGSGMGVSQSGGNLLITTGTTTYSETILRSVNTWAANTTIRYSTNLSQRIVNQEFYVELCDVIGDALAYTINSTTSVTVTIPSNPFTASNVGQSMYLGAMSVASCPTGRYVIASVSGSTVTFTVAAFPASGSGTLSLFGWNYYHCLYSGVTATNAGYDCQRNGWNSGDTTITINTTASPGHTVTMAQRNATANIFDELSASSTAIENTIRASRVRNIPEDTTQMRVQFRAVNLSSAPASTTTWTIGVIEVDNFVPQQVTLVSVEPQGLNWPLPVQVFNTPAVTVSSGTVTTVTTLTGTTTLTPGTGATNLGKAEDAVAASADTGVFALGVRRDAPVTSASATGDYNEIAVNKWGAVLDARLETTAKTYSASTSALVPAASATDIFTITGNATTTVYVTKITIIGVETTAGLLRVDLIKRSTADTSGTSTAPTAVPHDAADAAASATLLAYTANPTTGTLVGIMKSVLLPVASVTASTNNIYEFSFGTLNKPVVLSGTSQVLGINLAGATVTGGSFYISIEWYEI